MNSKHLKVTSEEYAKPQCKGMVAQDVPVGTVSEALHMVGERESHSLQLMQIRKKVTLLRKLGLPVSPLCEEEGFNLAKSQQGFITFLVRPSIQPLATFTGETEWLTQLEENFAYWGKAGEEETE